jgi:hypothetical protein
MPIILGMPLPDKDKIGAAVGDEITAACDAQSAASRFSQNGRKNAATEAALGAIRGHMARDDEIELPRFATIAAGREAVHVIHSRAFGEKSKTGKRQVETVELLAIPWAHLAVEVHGGAMWTRVVLIDRVEQRSAQVWIGRIMAGRKETLRTLTEQAGATV